MIKAKRIQDVRDLLKSQAFSDWNLHFETLHRDMSDLRARDPDLLTHTVLRAGEFEDLAHQAENTYAGLDGSFEKLSQYEQQRAAASNAWDNLGRAEYQLAEHRQAASELRAKLAANRKDEQTAAVQAESARLEAELNVEERLVEEWDKQVGAARTRFEQETERRDELWRVVEEAWLRAFRANMARIEYAFLGTRARADQEAMSRGEGTTVVGEGDLVSVEAERGRVERELTALLEQAESDFDCVAIAEFLYWPDQDDLRAALCVPLVGDMHHLNLQVTKLRIYRVERAKGLKFIEPLPEGSDDDEDARLDSFFVDRPQASRQ